MKKRKWRNFQASISDVKQFNPLFSTCKILVMYHGQNRNMSYISKETVEKALPTIKNIPIVGEFSIEKDDFKGHGGSVDLSDYRFIHTTKPYGVVPESAVWEWEVIGGREYLTIDGCYLWTGRYEEAGKVIERAKGQSMEIEVTDGDWDFDNDIYNIKAFNFSALCILGEDVEPAFEDANIKAYSAQESLDSFKNEFSTMLFELKESLNEKEGEDEMNIKKILEKYNLTMEQVTAKGIKLDQIAPEDLEKEIVKAFEIGKDENKNGEADKDENNEKAGEDTEKEGKATSTSSGSNDGSDSGEAGKTDNGEDKGKEVDIIKGDGTHIEPNHRDDETIIILKNQLQDLKDQLDAQNIELKELRGFKLQTQKKEHAQKAEKMFNNFQLTEADIKDLDIHKFSIEDLESKCYEILGRKMAENQKKEFSKNSDNGGIKINLTSGSNSGIDDVSDSRYGSLFDN